MRRVGGKGEQRNTNYDHWTIVLVELYLISSVKFQKSSVAI